MDPYQMGFDDYLDGDGENPFTEMSPEWVEYERGWDEAYEVYFDMEEY